MISDFKDLLRIFAKEEVQYLIVGANAVMHHTQPRYTKDLDIWIRPTKDKARRISRAFVQFGIPLIEVTEEDFAKEGLQYVVGVSPSQIDFLTSLPGAASFEEAWASRSTQTAGSVEVTFLGKTQLIATETHAGRPQDLADLDELRRASE